MGLNLEDACCRLGSPRSKPWDGDADTKGLFEDCSREHQEGEWEKNREKRPISSPLWLWAPGLSTHEEDGIGHKWSHWGAKRLGFLAIRFCPFLPETTPVPSALISVFYVLMWNELRQDKSNFCYYSASVLVAPYSKSCTVGLFGATLIVLVFQDPPFLASGKNRKYNQRQIQSF